MHEEIKVGCFTLCRDSGGTLWILKEGGESLSCGPETEANLFELLYEFWKEVF